MRVSGVPWHEDNRKEGGKTERSIGLVFIQGQLRIQRDLQDELQEQLKLPPTCRRQEKSKELKRGKGRRG